MITTRDYLQYHVALFSGAIRALKDRVKDKKDYMHPGREEWKVYQGYKREVSIYLTALQVLNWSRDCNVALAMLLSPEKKDYLRFRDWFSNSDWCRHHGAHLAGLALDRVKLVTQRVEKGSKHCSMVWKGYEAQRVERFTPRAFPKIEEWVHLRDAEKAAREQAVVLV